MAAPVTTVLEWEWAALTDFGNWLESENDNFNKALEENDLPQDKNPKREPFKSKYAARKTFQGLVDECLKYTEKYEAMANVEFRLKQYVKGTTAVLQSILGQNYVDAEEVSEGERRLMTACTLLEDIRRLPRYIITSIQTYGALGILWAGRGEHEKSLEFLQEAESLYESYTYNDQTKSVAPQSAAQLITTGSDESRWAELERAHTHTLFFLAQCHGHLGNPARSAKYCHLTLKRQLEAKEYDPLDWAINCAGISQYYLGLDDWVAVAHCLSCSSKIAAEKPPTSEAEQEAHANIARCWLKYMLNLLDYSTEEDDQAPKKAADTIQFENLDLDDYSHVPKRKPKDFDEAKVVFQQGQTWVKKCLKFYTMRDHVSDYVAVVQDHSKLYAKLIDFVKQPNDKCKLHKRRLDMLIPVESELNPQYFLAICRQLQYEIAETYQEMMNQKRDRFTDANPPDAKSMTKIRKLGQDSIKYYNKFIDTCKDNTSKEIPKTLDETLVRPYLRANFSIAGIYRKLLTENIQDYLANSEKSLKHFGTCILYCENNPSYDGFKEEVEICKEMVNMIPIQTKRAIDKVTQG